MGHTPTLKPCPAPWCAEHGDEIQVAGYRGMKFVACGHCGCATPDSKTEAEAINYWNARPEALEQGVVRELVEAARRGLNYIENSESEFGIKLESGDMLRKVLAKIGAK